MPLIFDQHSKEIIQPVVANQLKRSSELILLQTMVSLHLPTLHVNPEASCNPPAPSLPSAEWALAENGWTVPLSTELRIPNASETEPDCV